MAKKSTTPARRGRRAKGDKSKLVKFRPPKPYKGFELTPVSGGQWAKRINGRLYYFGRWGKTVNGKMERLPGDGWEDALRLYKAQAADLHAGRTPRTGSASGELTVREMCNQFMADKQELVDSGELKIATLNEYRLTCKKLVAAFGATTLVDDLTDTDFKKLRAKLAMRLGPVGLSNQVGKVRAVFIHANRKQQIPKTFKKPSAKTMREHEAKQTPKMFEAEEIRQLLANSKGQLHAMILLAINCGMGNTDCSELEFRHVDLDAGWLDYPRPKTSVRRKSRLWSETVAALREVISCRKKPISKADQEIIFLTKYGSRWVRDVPHTTEDASGNKILAKVVSTNAISGQFAKCMKACELNSGRNFYALRHSYQTQAENSAPESPDFPAIALTMGHATSANDMSARYRERISDERLIRIADAVHQWLWPPKQAKTVKKAAKAKRGAK